jgi:hypothetical protein
VRGPIGAEAIEPRLPQHRPTHTESQTRSARGSIIARASIELHLYNDFRYWMKPDRSATSS